MLCLKYNLLSKSEQLIPLLLNSSPSFNEFTLFYIPRKGLCQPMCRLSEKSAKQHSWRMR